MLARRYLNPRRSVLSSFTLVSLVGVVLGVLVLVVVMAVYAGLERDVKARLLGFTPHILLRHQPGGLGDLPMQDWRDAAEMASTLPRVAAATAHVSDNVILDHASWQRPVQFHGIDGSDAAQIEGIRRMLDLTNHPDSTADLGLDDRIVISSLVASQFGLGVGDTVRLYSTRNFEEVMRAYKTTEHPVLREAEGEAWQRAKTILGKVLAPEESGWRADIAGLREAYTVFESLGVSEPRDHERSLLDQLLVALEAGSKDETAGCYRFDANQKDAIDQAIEDLETTDAEQMDSEMLKSLRHIVLPKEAVVAGVYQASQMAVTPDLFLPLALAQDLAGMDDAVQGVALRLDDAYAAEQVASAARATLGPDWSLLTWGDQYQTFFSLINQQRVMMYFALSFIVLVSAFSMMAVMFTVTIQKRREIGVMKALGAAPGQIIRVFLYQGMILGAVGALVGVGLGRLFIHHRGSLQQLFRAMGFDPFAASFTGFGVLPAHNLPLEQAGIAIMAFALCSLAALVPAFLAARCDAAKSLRNL